MSPEVVAQSQIAVIAKELRATRSDPLPKVSKPVTGVALWGSPNGCATRQNSLKLPSIGSNSRDCELPSARMADSARFQVT